MPASASVPTYQVQPTQACSQTCQGMGKVDGSEAVAEEVGTSLHPGHLQLSQPTGTHTRNNQTVLTWVLGHSPQPVEPGVSAKL